MFKILILSLLVSSQLSQAEKNAAEQSFTIDSQSGQFLKDGKPFQYVSGTMHYFRVPHQYWADRMMKMRAAGLNALETYIEWSFHEPEPENYTFSEDANIEEYFKLAQNHNLSVILRPGPYIDAERDMGGLPYWLMTVNPSMKLRTNDPSYMHYVERWFTILFSKVKPYLYCNGGPIIMVQVENEYGSYPACDRDYTTGLRDFIRKQLGDQILLFTTDGAGDGYLQCGRIPGVYATVDFGAGAKIPDAFKAQHHFEAYGPKVNSEFYPGWLDMWGEPHAKVDKDSVAKTLDEMLAVNASVNIYVFHGGTSFGFTSGALASNTYTPCITSYDYDAPLTEAGDPTDKYFLIRNVTSKYLALPNVPLPVSSIKADYGRARMHFAADLWQLLRTPSCTKIIQSTYPLTFEALQQNHGYVLYCTEVHERFPDPSVLELKGLADRAYVYIDKEYVGILSRTGSLFTLPIQIRPNQTLCILVENQGRIAYGTGIKDFKGLTSNATLNGHVLSNWVHYSLPFNDTSSVRLVSQSRSKHAAGKTGVLSVYTGWIAINRNQSELADTFLHLPGWHKGVAFINGRNLGRYWPVQGPQVTLYVPKHYLLPWPAKNRVMIVEQEKSPCGHEKQHCHVEFISQPILDGPVAQMKRSFGLFRKF